MKQEEMNDISTILIEATDERSAVMNQVSKQTKPVIIVLPEQADQIFRQPGDFFELKRLKRERGLSITLVISGHERIRNMARRQGFQVYTSAETCARAMARRDRLYTMRGISLPGTTGVLDQTRFTAQGDEGDEDTPWSYDVRMQQPATTSASFTANADDQDEDTPWSYDVQMQQAASTAETPETMRMQTKELSSGDVPWSYDVQMSQADLSNAETRFNPSMQGGDESDEDTPWSYDVQMNQNKTPDQQQHPQRTAWMLAEEELWNQNHRLPTQRDQHTLPSYMVGAPLEGALRGASASLWETPVPPSFTETLENLVALSGEKLGAPRINAHNSGSLDAGARVRPTRLTQLPDEIPTQPGNAHPYMVRASLAGALRPSAPDTEPLYPLLETQPLTDSEHSGSRIALMLTALLILGILGGVGCGYILTLMHVNLAVLTSTISSL